MTALALETLTVAAYTLGAPTAADVEAVTALLIACSLADEGVVDYSLEEVQANWDRRGFTLSTDAWLARSPDGTLGGYAEMWARERQPGAEQRFILDAHVHPDHRGRGLGRRLFAQMVARAEAYLESLPPGTSGRLYAPCVANDAAAREIFESAGFTVETYGWTMRRELDTPAPEPQWPAGLTVRAFVPGQDDAATHALIMEAFADLPNYTHSSLDDWRARLMHPGLFKPEYWYLAYDGDLLAGCSLCFSFPEAGWLANLAVRRPYRKRGLALALLHHTFNEFHRTGHPAMELGVDTANATGATRVYERAGMHIARESVVYEKALSCLSSPLRA